MEEDIEGEMEPEYDIDDEELAEQDITNVAVGQKQGGKGLLKKIRKRRSIVE